jgi:hypothetical protein
VVAVLIAVSVAGCAGASQNYKSMSQQVSSASSSIRSVAIALSQESAGKGLSSMTDTSVEEAVTKVIGADSQLAAMAVTGTEGAARDHALDRVRRAEDALLAIRSDLSTRRMSALGDNSQLVAIAKKLQALSTSLENR